MRSDTMILMESGYNIPLGTSQNNTETEEKPRHYLGKLSTLLIGYGAHQAWVFSAMFGTASVFGLPAFSNEGILTPVFTDSAFFYALCLLLFGLFDQKFLPYLIRRRTASIAAVLVALGTLLILPSAAEGTVGAVIRIVSGLLTGFGSATLIVFWGTAFARHSSASILTNTAVAIVVAVAIYTVLLHLIPAPYSGIIAACLPLVELALLWAHTPRSYMTRHEVPLFNPLPIKKTRTLLLFGLPMLLFGFVLGFMRLDTVVYMISRIDLTAQLPLLISAGCAAIAIIISGFVVVNDERPNVLLRPLLPIIALSILFIPLSESDGSNISYAVIVMAGYMCLEGLVWILLGSMAQRFRISPVQLFGIGRGSVGVGMLVAFALAPSIISFFSGTGAESLTNISVMLVALIAAFALMPHVSDIRRAISLDADKGETVTDFLNIQSNTTHAFNEKAQEHTTEQEQQQEPTVQDAETNHHKKEAEKSSMSDTEEQPSQRLGLFRKKCERIANRYLLSAREAEVLFFLAKGHNAASIMEKLYISEGTAKTHIRHIYNKTDVHSQQELMKMVADEWID